MFNNGPGQKVFVSDQVQYAPKNYHELDTVIETYDDGYSSTFVGSGVFSSFKCESCGHGGEDVLDDEKNSRIYLHTTMERNGNYSTRTEIVCKKCHMYTVIETWEEG